MNENLIRYTTCKLIDNEYYDQWVSENTDTSKNTASLLPTSNQNGKRLYVYDSNQNKIVDIYLYTDNNYNLIVDDDGYCLYINNDTNIPQIVDCNYWNDELWIVDENDNEITINNFSEAVENTIYEIDDNTWKYENTKIPEYEVTLYLFERETNIEDNLFEETKISRIEFLTEFVNTIGYMSFSYCELLTSIDLPSSLTSIGGEAFNNCTSLVSVICKAITPPTLGSYNFTAVNDTLYVPANSVEAYKASNWNDYFSSIEAIPEPIPPTPTKNHGFNFNRFIDLDYVKQGK